MSRGIHVKEVDGVLLAGVVDRGVLTDLLAEPVDDRPRPGDVHLSRIDRRVRDTGSAFVDLGLNATAYLPDMGQGSSEGLVVQIARIGRDGKLDEVTRDIALPGKLLVYRPLGAGITVSRKLDSELATRWRPEPPGGWIIRRAAARATDRDIAEETSRLADRWRQIVEARQQGDVPRLLHKAPDVAGRLILDTPDIDDIRVAEIGRRAALKAWLKVTVPALVEKARGDPLDLAEEVPALLSSEVSLSNGASILIEPTSALTAIDVNAGGGMDHFQINREAAREIAGQLRLRNIGGIVVIDFISMKRRDARTAVVDALRNAIDGDPAKVRMSRSMSGLGLVELARERRGAGLCDVMRGRWPTGSTRGNAKV